MQFVLFSFGSASEEPNRGNCAIFLFFRFTSKTTYSIPSVSNAQHLRLHLRLRFSPCFSLSVRKSRRTWRTSTVCTPHQWQVMNTLQCCGRGLHGHFYAPGYEKSPDITLAPVLRPPERLRSVIVPLKDQSAYLVLENCRIFCRAQPCWYPCHCQLHFNRNILNIGLKSSKQHYVDNNNDPLRKDENRSKMRTSFRHHPAHKLIIIPPRLCLLWRLNRNPPMWKLFPFPFLFIPPFINITISRKRIVYWASAPTPRRQPLCDWSPSERWYERLGPSEHVHAQKTVVSDNMLSLLSGENETKLIAHEVHIIFSVRHANIKRIYFFVTGGTWILLCIIAVEEPLDFIASG